MAVPVEIDDVDWTEVKRPNPHFFKVLVGDYIQRMKIPPNFVKKLQEDMTTKASSSSDPPIMTASIEGPNGRTWYAELEKTTTGVFFTTGWSKFARDHSLKEHELLIFRYNGCMSFTVLIFDKTACEKEDQDGGSGSGGRKARLKLRKLAFGQDELGDQLKVKEKSVSSTEPKITDTETEDVEEMNVVETSTRKHKKASERSKRGHKHLSRGHSVTEKEKLKAQEAAHFFASENPFFVIRVKASHVYSSCMRLELPRNFLKYLEEAPGKQDKGSIPVKLGDSTGRTWCVLIERDADRTHFTSGWSKFVRDHNLRENEFLVFEYDGIQQFSVTIFDETLCEREIMIREEVVKRAPEVISLSDSEGSEGIESDEEEEEFNTNAEEEEDENEDYETDSPPMNKFKKRGASSVSPPHPSSSRKKMKGQYVSRRRAVTDLEKQKAAEAAFFFTSKNPYCMIRMTANFVYRWSSLRFPMHFSKNDLPRKKTKFVLKNSAGKEWIGSYSIESKSSRGLISRGWTHFAHHNNLEEDDYCVFELVNSKDPELLVHIFRVVEKVVPAVWIQNK